MMKRDKGTARANTYQQWALFMRRWMPFPGRYRASVDLVRGPDAVITLYGYGKSGFKASFRCELMYDAESYEDMPRVDGGN